MNWNLDPAACLGPTEFFDSEHPAIQDCVNRLGLAGRGPKEKAVRVFEFVRNRITYEFQVRFGRDEYVASFILADGKGFCVRKAVLLCTLGRAVGIPTAIVMADLRDYTMPTRIVEEFGTDTLPYHGLTAFHLDGGWVRADATLSPELVRRKGYRLVEFNGKDEALLLATTLSGEPHVEYTGWRGIYADLPYDEIMAEFRPSFRGTVLEGPEDAFF